MVHSKKDSMDLVRVPTLDDWIKAKELSHKKATKLSFIKKLEILDKMSKEASCGQTKSLELTPS